VALANWVTGELVARIGDGDPAAAEVTPTALADLVALVEGKEISNQAGKEVLDRLVTEGGEPRAIVEEAGLALAGADELGGIVERVLSDHAEAVEQIRAGNGKAIGAIIGAVMRETRGRADGGEVQRLVREQIGS